MKILVKVTKEILEKSMYCGVDRKSGVKIPHEFANIGRNCGIANAIG